MPRKTIDANECAIKLSDGDDGIKFEGYLSVFERVDSYGDTVVKGAYLETLSGRKRMPPMLLNHDQRSVPIGVWEDMKEDDVGLRVKGRLLKHDVAKQAGEAMREGAMTGLSIGYRATKFEENDHGGLNLLKIDLREGSVVTMPAEDEARIDVVKFEDLFGSIEEIESEKEIELILRDAGYSRKMAKALMSQFKTIYQRDADGLQEQIKAIKAELDQHKARSARDESSARINSLLERMKNAD